MLQHIQYLLFFKYETLTALLRGNIYFIYWICQIYWLSVLPMLPIYSALMVFSYVYIFFKNLRDAQMDNGIRGKQTAKVLWSDLPLSGCIVLIDGYFLPLAEDSLKKDRSNLKKKKITLPIAHGTLTNQDNTTQ